MTAPRGHTVARYVIARLGWGAVTLLLASVVTFGALQLLPGDAATVILGRDASPERLASLRGQLHLDDPVWSQYLQWITSAVRGDFGLSAVNQNQSVNDLLWSRGLNSITLVLCASAVAIPVSIALGAFAAGRIGGVFDWVSSVTLVALASLPEFVIGILLIAVFATTWLHILPAVSIGGGGWVAADDFASVVLPSVTLMLVAIPYLARIVRGTAVDVLSSDYVAQAELKGLKRSRILVRHALPNTLGPVAQAIALNLAWLTGGVVTVEYVFNYPGIGTTLVDAVAFRDIPIVLAVTMLTATIYIVVNLIADVVGLLANPLLRRRTETVAELDEDASRAAARLTGRAP